ncbi:CvpA family protein [Cytophagaceae bacterium ABcell3]|nr:CvpA family protein [Cytophagaceae bacterium ABcell3]
MKAIDIILIVLLLLGAYQGYRKGFLREIISFFALVAAIVAAFKLLNHGINLLKEHLPDSILLVFFSFLLIFVVVLIGLHLIGKILKKILDLTLLGHVDSLAGALFGAARMAFIVSLVLWLINSSEVISMKAYTQESSLYMPIVNFAPGTVHYLTEIVPFEDVFPVIQEYFKKV